MTTTTATSFTTLTSWIASTQTLRAVIRGQIEAAHDGESAALLVSDAEVLRALYDELRHYKRQAKAGTLDALEVARDARQLRREAEFEADRFHSERAAVLRKVADHLVELSHSL